EQEIFSIEELISKFSVDRVSKAGAKFDFEKAKWFNHEWIKKTDNTEILPQIEGVLNQHEVTSRPSDDVLKVLALVKERMTFVEDFWEQASFFFTIPDIYDVDAVKPKWNENKTAFFQNIAAEFETMQEWTAISLEPFFKNKVADSGMKIGEL